MVTALERAEKCYEQICLSDRTVTALIEEAIRSAEADMKERCARVADGWMERCGIDGLRTTKDGRAIAARIRSLPEGGRQR